MAKYKTFIREWGIFIFAIIVSSALMAYLVHAVIVFIEHGMVKKGR